MKKILLALFSIVSLWFSCNAQPIEKNITFTENTEIFQNPGQGWENFGTKFNPRGKVNYGAGYHRYYWSQLNPKEDEYNWAPIDKALENFSKLGLPFYLRIMGVNTSGDYPPKYTSPKWVFDKGATFTVYEKPVNPSKQFPEGKAPIIVPNFSDPIYIEMHKKFIEALAKRYDKDERLAGVDLGSFGNWGEWHCHGLGIKNHATLHSYEVRKQYADMYLKNFKKTEITFMSDNEEVFAYAVGKKKIPRVGFRRDGVGSPSHFKRWFDTSDRYVNVKNMSEIWKYRPIMLEFFTSVSDMKKRGWDILYSYEWILKNHVSLVDDIPFRTEEIEEGSPEDEGRKKIDLYAGARLVPQTAKIVVSEKKIIINIKGINKGVSRIYLPYRMKYEIRDSSGKIVMEKISSCNPRKIFPGDFEISDDFSHSLRKGEKYTLSLRIYHIKKIFKDFRFASKNLNEDGSLNLGTIEVE